MDFVDWCGHVLKELIKVKSTPDALSHGGVFDTWLGKELFGEAKVTDSGYWESTRRKAVMQALDVLERFDLISKEKVGQMLKMDIKPLGREIASDMSSIWRKILVAAPHTDSIQLLTQINYHSQRIEEDHVWLEDVDRNQLPALGWSDKKKRMHAIRDLEQFNLVHSQPIFGSDLDLKSTYEGIVWITRGRVFKKCDIFISHITEESALAQNLKQILLNAFGTDLKVFVSSDYRSIPGGKVWYSEIIESLQAAPVILVILSKVSVERRWINFEAGVGIGCNNTVVPLVTGGLTKAKVGLPLSQFQVRDLNNIRDLEGIIIDISQQLVREAVEVDFETFVKGIESSGEGRLTAIIRQVPVKSYDDCTEHRISFDLLNNSHVTLANYRMDIEIPSIFLAQGTSTRVEVENRRTTATRFFRITAKDHDNKLIYSGDLVPRFFRITLTTNPSNFEHMNELVRVGVFAENDLTQSIEMSIEDILKLQPHF